MVLHNYRDKHEVGDSVMRDVFSLRSILRLYLEHHRRDLEESYGGSDRKCYFHCIVMFLEDTHTLMHRTHPWLEVMTTQKMLSENRKITVLPHMREAIKLAMDTVSDLQQVVEYALLSMGIKELDDVAGNEGDASPPGGSAAAAGVDTVPSRVGGIPPLSPAQVQSFRRGLAFQILEDLWLPTIRLREAILGTAERLTSDQPNSDNIEMRERCAEVRRTRTASCRMAIKTWEWR